ncbi:phosphoribosylformylglycinamidine synthase subunit PurL [Anaeromyxobacter dehalogenans]|uniref:Phosphoribosylformylglycinamidine synthase subunit PurL n=1 Tax=Anaeromyxobacter dehalogenans (strain 2CP-C) TaxID=290397 RepID=PURL_ANADE|nr:phosphoribosylformylglycinamidine synthase subunit PurL [Anaeromyxobacter dehalogenans]Q2IHC1.1 RecName: Full=Phosphoribosylformylglycinamidine synthase subunit PurL; Short=FGAM synthase; AltName: Full=Formylglycinamide ribonucleotide amidotransferase subunit II; Short=FGAR amidotransferase II; Short=FGAR-AT II; AltName: Full=Glutamine amidotransferase PurL; AltName: Full=Phosphoribosylformylglycinamidine synthase subunit II [Anaeromyxobacter dehalogenans 2CP-C]ABC83978.1 phosphoribosylformylg
MTEQITPEIVAQHGLKPDEYQRILEHLGRVPTLTELGVFSVMWSEHCSYKSSRVHLKTFPTSGPRVLQGPGENAGVVDLGDGLAAAFKMESHNHPSYIEPYQGAATGVGGILRDVFTMGARPIASLNALRFGDPSHPRTAYLLEGVVAGIGGYGNCMGVPTVGGEVAFHPSYNGNCLVNAFTLGILPADKIFRGTAAGVGNPVMYVGAKTGRDGIHGATMASAEFDASTEEKRPTVQVGDPFMEKLLLEACLELFQTDAVVGIQDMGAAGLTSSSVEMAGRGGNGLDLFLDKVPLREEGMTPYEILLSESQERMLLVAAEGKEELVRSICEKWDLDVAVIGRVTASGRWRAHWRGEVVADLPVDPLTEGAPKYHRPMTPHPALPALHAFDPATLPEPSDLGAALLRLLARPTIASKEWVYRQYDHMVRLVGAVRPGGDAAVVRLAVSHEKHAHKGIALSVGVNGRFCFLDPYLGAMHAVAECARNIACVGGEPIAITDCLNFGNPEKPEIMWQFAECVRGIGDACRAFGTPVVSGNVSLYNETEGQGILPTPTVGMVGLVEPVERTCHSTFRAAGDVVALVGSLQGEVGGSEYLSAEHGKEAGRPPALDLAREKAVQETVRRAVRAGLLSSAHDCSEGGLAVALAESCMMHEVPADGSTPAWIGCAVRIPFPVRKDFVLFGEDASRILVSLPKENAARFVELAQECGAPVIRLGAVGGDRLEIQGALSVPVEELARAWRDGIPAVLRRDAAHAGAAAPA